MQDFFFDLTEEELPSNIVGDSIADNPKVMDWEKRTFATRYDEFVVDEPTYNNFANGKKRNARWVNYVTCPNLKSAMQRSLSKNKMFVVSNERANSAMFVRMNEQLKETQVTGTLNEKRTMNADDLDDAAKMYLKKNEPTLFRKLLSGAADVALIALALKMFDKRTQQIPTNNFARPPKPKEPTK